MKQSAAYGLAIVGVLFGLAGVGIGLCAEYLPEGEALRGTTVSGSAQGKGESLTDWLLRLQTELGRREVSVDIGDSTLQVSFAELGGELDIERTRAALLQQATSGSTLQRFERAVAARRGQEHLPPFWSFNRQIAHGFLTELAPSLGREGENAQVDLANHRKVADQPGRQLDVEASLSILEAAAHNDEKRVALVFRSVPAKVRLESLITVDISKVLASFETDFKGKAGRRKINIERAAKYLDGTIIEPGALFSFNGTVGPRVEGRGFVYAPVIVDDILEPGIGGGVCQVASTLFAAAIYGNLEIVRRRSHSRPSGYAPLGLDATVIDGEVDLRFRNPYAVPLMIHAFLPTPTTIRAEFLGYEPRQKVDHQYTVTERHDFFRRVIYTSEVTAPKRKQKGHYGYDVTSFVSVSEPGGTTQRRTYPSKYYPVPEVYWVPPDYDISLLPPLPEGATETVVGDEPKPGEDSAPDSNRIAEPPS